jgi:ankyrin repeat protein
MPEIRETWFQAIRTGDLATVERLLAEDRAWASARHESGLSSVMWACYTRQFPVVALLRAAGAPLDFFEAVAAGAGDAALARLDAEPGLARAVAPDGFTALHLAAFFGHPALASRLLALGADASAVAANDTRVQPLHSAVAAAQEEIVRALLEHGAAPDPRQQGGWTPLMGAAQHGRDGIVELLLRHGADTALRSDDGRAAADMADEQGHHALAARLRGANG